MTAAAGPPPALTRKGARKVWLGFAAALAAAVAASLLLAPARPADAMRVPLLLAAGALTAVELVAVYLLTASLRRRAAAAPVPPPPEAIAAVQVVVAAGLATGAALFACLCQYLTRERLFLLLVAACAAVLVHWYPSDARWARLLPGGPPGAGARPMVRR